MIPPIDINKIIQLVDDGRKKAGEFIQEISNLNKSMRKVIDGLEAIRELVNFLERNESVIRELLSEMKKMNDNFELVKEVLSKMNP